MNRSATASIRATARDSDVGSTWSQAGNEIGFAWVAQLVERVLGKDEVSGSIPLPGSRVEQKAVRG